LAEAEVAEATAAEDSAARPRRVKRVAPPRKTPRPGKANVVTIPFNVAPRLKALADADGRLYFSDAVALIGDEMTPIQLSKVLKNIGTRKRDHAKNGAVYYEVGDGRLMRTA
jgi:hypothetical protein